MITHREVGLQIPFDIVFDAKAKTQAGNPVGVILPIGRIGHGEVVSSADFIKVDKFMGCLDDLKTGGGIQGRFQAYPGKNAFIVKSLESLDPVIGESCGSFPLKGKGWVKAGKRAGKRVSLWPEKIQISERSLSTFGQCGKAETVSDQGLQGFTGKGIVAWMVGIGSKGEHYLGIAFDSLIFSGVSGKPFDKILAWICSSVKFLAFHLDYIRNVAIGAFMPATPVGVGCQGGIFAGLTFGGIDDRAALNRDPVWVDRVFYLGRVKHRKLAHWGSFRGLPGFRRSLWKESSCS